MVLPKKGLPNNAAFQLPMAPGFALSLSLGLCLSVFVSSLFNVISSHYRYQNSQTFFFFTFFSTLQTYPFPFNSFLFVICWLDWFQTRTDFFVDDNNFFRCGVDRIRMRHVSRVGYVKRTIGKREFKSRRIKRVEVPKVPMALQELFLLCQDVFKGPDSVPLPHHVHNLCRLLDKMKAEDVGLCSDLQFFKPHNVVKATPPRVTYTTIYQCPHFSLCIFFIPANGVIPLHNHPGMTVFSKLLLGKMHIKSYDWAADQPSVSKVDSLQTPTSQLRLAKLKADDVFVAPCKTSVLYPTTGGNIHAFTAITPCAVLDVLGPPYSAEDGRDCSYYKDYPYSSYCNGENKMEGESYGWLEEIVMPENSQMDGIEYLGPQIMEMNCNTTLADGKYM